MNDKTITSKPKLDVYFDRHRVGQISANGIRMQFSYAEPWLKSETSFPISVSTPLTAASIENETANNFFVNLLPEERIRKRTCEKLGISEGNNYELLKRIGGDCAGALTIVEEGAPPSTKQNVYAPISNTHLRRLPLIATSPQFGGRSFLIGGKVTSQQQIAYEFGGERDLRAIGNQRGVLVGSDQKDVGLSGAAWQFLCFYKRSGSSRF